MKKLLTLLSFSLLLSGCATSGSASITDPTTPLITVGNTEISKGSVYNMMFETQGASQIIADTLEYISTQEIEVTDAMVEEANGSLVMQEMMYGDQFEEILIANGFESKEDYIETIVIPGLKVAALTQKYIDSNYDTMIETYTPKKVQVMAFADVETAQKALDEVTSGTDFTQVGTDLKSSIPTSETVYTVKSDYPIDVKIFIAEATEDGLLSNVILDAEKETYYVVQINANDANSFKEDAIAAIAKIADVEAEAFDYYLDLYEFAVYDETLHNQIKSTYPDYLD